jgi:hypothetical protein
VPHSALLEDGEAKAESTAHGLYAADCVCAAAAAGALTANEAAVAMATNRAAYIFIENRLPS